MKRAVVVLALCALAAADMYMHYPPGSNGRNRERNDNRDNGDRLFDSQNNGKGGYPFRGMATKRGLPDPLTYYTGSVLRIEWTNQHACGDNPNIVCDVVIQYGCDPIEMNLFQSNMTASPLRKFPGIRDGYPDSANEVQSDPNNPGYLRLAFSGQAGQNERGTATIPSDQFINDPVAANRFYTMGEAGGVEYGMHENNIMYNTCRKTSRNRGLYVADQKLNLNDARATRQNPNGARRGLECPEERDYYPYWNNKINRWTDVAVLTNDLAKCEYFQTKSANVIGYGWCEGGSNFPNNVQPITATDCARGGGVWTDGTPNGIDSDTGNTFPPDCLKHPANRDNHLGNSAPQETAGSADQVQGAGGITGQPETAHYLWNIPMHLRDQRCVIRVRYNMSTLDYNSDHYAYLKGKDGSGVYSHGINSSYNCERIRVVDSGDVDADGQVVDPRADACTNKLTAFSRPLYNRPYIDVFNGSTPKLSIAINTNQAGRTFQDRSYVFDIRQAPVSGRIWNLNVRGRRGNIVQAYPAVEYDFVPSRMVVTQGDWVHIQFHGSDFNEAKNANNGEGWQYSDRHNIVQTDEAAMNIPTFRGSISLFDSLETAQRWAMLNQASAPGQCNNSFYNGATNEQNDIRNCGKLNRAPARFPEDPTVGLLRVGRSGIGHGTLAPSGSGTYYYVSTRNNNFSNRSHKASIVVIPSADSGLTAGQKAGISIGVLLGASAIVGGLLFYGKKNPTTRVGGYVTSLNEKMNSCRPAAATTSAPDMPYQRGA